MKQSDLILNLKNSLEKFGHISEIQKVPNIQDVLYLKEADFNIIIKPNNQSVGEAISSFLKNSLAVIESIPSLVISQKEIEDEFDNSVVLIRKAIEERKKFLRELDLLI